MALTPAERQRLHRERKRQRERRTSDATSDFVRMPFSRFEDGHFADFELALGLCGIDAPQFRDETSGRDIAARFDEFGAAEGYYDQFQGALGRAELTIACLLDAASALASAVNQFKLDQIDRALEAIEQRDLSDPKAKKQALADAARLSKLQDKLKRQVRWSLNEWKTGGANT